ncbi:MAG: hypothetical protein HUU55_00575 [Myxococcales bacterium]|nr:hypothetical protein [Myxococcales bacterium]
MLGSGKRKSSKQWIQILGLGWMTMLGGAACAGDDSEPSTANDTHQGHFDTGSDSSMVADGVSDTAPIGDVPLEDTGDVVVDPATAACQNRCSVAEGCPDVDLSRCVQICLNAPVDACENQCLDMALDCDALALCLGAQPVVSPFEVAQYTVKIRGLAGHFIARTTRGQYSLKDRWTGRDSLFFLTMADGYAYPESLWASNFSFFLLEAPKNVQLFFMDVAGSSPDLDAMQEKIDKSLSKLDFAEQCHWRRQIHFVTQPPGQITGWLGEFMQAVGYFGFAVDRQQRTRILGMLQPPQSNGALQLSYLANEAVYFNFERDREQALAEVESTEVVMFDNKHVGTETIDVEFPSAQQMAAYDTMLIDFSAFCPEHLDQNCGEWDYLSYMFMCERPVEDNPWKTTTCQPKVEAAPEWLAESGICAGTPNFAAVPETLGSCADLGGECRTDRDCAEDVIAERMAVKSLNPYAWFEFETPGPAGWIDNAGVRVAENHGAFIDVLPDDGGVVGLNGQDVVTADAVFSEWTAKAFSIGVWFEPAMTTTSGVVWAIADRKHQPIVALQRDPDGGLLWVDGVTGTKTPVGVTVPDHAWALIVGVFDGTTFKLYVDGAKKGEWPLVWTPSPWDRLALGGKWNGTNGGDFLRGFLDDLVVFDRVITEAEIQTWVDASDAVGDVSGAVCMGYVAPVLAPGLCTTVEDCVGYTPAEGQQPACVGAVAQKDGVVGIAADTKPCQCELPEGGLTEAGKRQYTCVQTNAGVPGVCRGTEIPCQSDGECGQGESCVGALPPETGYADCNCPCDREIGRWITTYAREGRWVSDHSQFLPWFATGNTKRIRLNSGNAYDVTLKFLLQNRNKDSGAAKELVYLYGGGGYNATYNDKYQPVEVEIPADAKKVELFAYITGHGFGVEKANCAEFCNHTHHFTVNGRTFSHENSWANDQAGCKKQIKDGTVPNQYGTWPYGRGGWCPGMDVKPFVADVTHAVEPGKTTTITYKSLFEGEPYVPEPWESPFGGFPGNIVMNSWLVVYR